MKRASGPDAMDLGRGLELLIGRNVRTGLVLAEEALADALAADTRLLARALDAEGKRGSALVDAEVAGAAHGTRNKDVGKVASGMTNVLPLFKNKSAWFEAKGRDKKLPLLTERQWAEKLGMKEDAALRMAGVGTRLEEELALHLAGSIRHAEMRHHEFAVGKHNEPAPEVELAVTAFEQLLWEANIEVVSYQTSLYKELDTTLSKPHLFSVRGKVDFLGVQTGTPTPRLVLVDMKVQYNSTLPERAHAVQSFVYRELLHSMVPSLRRSVRVFVLHACLSRGEARLWEVDCGAMKDEARAIVAREPQLVSASEFWALASLTQRQPEAKEPAAPKETPEARPAEAADDGDAVIAALRKNMRMEKDENEALERQRAEGNLRADEDGAVLLVPRAFFSTDKKIDEKTRRIQAASRWMAVQKTLRDAPDLSTVAELKKRLKNVALVTDPEAGRVAWGHWVGRLGPELHAERLLVDVE